MLKPIDRPLALVAGAVALTLAVLAGLSFFESLPQQKGAHIEQSRGDQTVPESPDDRIARYTLLLAYFTAALAITAAVQIGFLLRADKTARISAEAALGAVRVAEKNAGLELRAHVFVHETRGALYSDPLRMVVRVQMKNCGKTPAYDVLGRFGAVLIPFDDLARFQAPEPGEFWERMAALPPEATLDISGRLALAETRSILISENAIVVYGDILYRDVFGAKHKTAFCLRCSGASGLDNGRFQYSLTGNEAD